jgi:hypothetical protein
VCGESRTHGDNGGDGETGRKIPRSVPTHCSVLVSSMPLKGTGELEANQQEARLGEEITW